MQERMKWDSNEAVRCPGGHAETQKVSRGGHVDYGHQPQGGNQSEDYNDVALGIALDRGEVIHTLFHRRNDGGGLTDRA